MAVCYNNPLAIFSRLFLDERLGVQGYVGAGLILLGVWVSSQSSKGEVDQSKDEVVVDSSIAMSAMEREEDTNDLIQKI